MVRLIAAIAILVSANFAVAQSSDDAQAWQNALLSGSSEAFEKYLEAYPDGQFSSLAFRCTVELSLMPEGHRCSVGAVEPGPVGPVNSQVGNFAVNLR